MREGVLYLTLEEIRAIVDDLKEDYQRQANQGIRKKDWEQGVGALASMEACDSFLFNCRLRSGEESPDRAQQRREALGASAPKRKRGAVTELPAPSPVVRKRVGGAE